MDRNLFKRTAIDWDDWLADGPVQALQSVVPVAPAPPVAQASMRPPLLPRARPYEQPAQPQQPIAQPPRAVPHSWREAMSVMQASAPIPQPVRPVAKQPPVHAHHSAASAEQQLLKVPRQAVVAQQQISPQECRRPAQPVTDQKQHETQTRAVLANARSIAQSLSYNSNDLGHIPVKQKRLRGRMWRSVAWFGAMSGTFAVSFGATVAPAYIHGKFGQEAEANAIVQSAVDQQGSAAVASSGTGSVAGTLSVASGAGSAIQGTAMQTGGDLPEGYKQIKTMYKSVALTAQRQNLPTSYNGDPGNVKTAVENLQLQTVSIATVRWGTVYVSEAQGVQLALLANKQYLMVIQAQGHLNNDEWKGFLESFDGS